ncbi:gamma carbonic anhydrase family protein [Desulfosarcina ovata]|uniref:Gamma carbonic anhydrase family protein n=1 Tax=Desulfosarcina ovata subsp. ovata TaxID=2752305 RepID=A0A5K8AGJ5_9BACT|nr:gamma carbonic anhydrase family protein [Desulfosarcina ovata]BBO91813.1 gamma carbonic anhydrase family protein [Desulfosarcina ovata subsp. ovata]
MEKIGMITPFQGRVPQIGASVWIDPSARLIGNVQVADGASIWPGAILRADESEIRIGTRSAILDQCLLESPHGFPVVVAADALISHKVCLHGATVESGALVGIGAIVLDGAVIGAGALVGAGAVVAPNAQIPPGTLALGQPAKPIRPLKANEISNIRSQLALLSRKAGEYRAMGER